MDQNRKCLAAEFCKHVDQQLEGAETIIVFEWHSNGRLKSKVWLSHQKKGISKAKQIDYNIEPGTDLTERCKKDIFMIATKNSLTKLLRNAIMQHFKILGVEYFIAGNGLIYSSCTRGVTNHEKGEKAIILG